MGLMADWRGIIRVILSLMSSGRLIGFLSGGSVQFSQSLPAQPAADHQNTSPFDIV